MVEPQLRGGQQGGGHRGHPRMPGEPLDLRYVLPPAEVLDEGARVIAPLATWASGPGPASTASIAAAASSTSRADRTCRTHATPSAAKAATASSSANPSSMGAL